MQINKIKGLQLTTPIEVTVEKIYTVECKELNISGSGATKKKAIEDFGFAVLDIYEDFEMDHNFTEEGKEFEERFLAYFE